MSNIDQLEVLLRTVPQYFLFGGVALCLFSWMYKKEKLGLWGEVMFLILGLAAFILLLSGIIPSPKTQGIVEEDIKKVIKVLFMFSLLGLLSAVGIAIRLIRKKASKIVFYTIFVLSLLVFFMSTNLSKVNFQLNQPETGQINLTDTIKQ